jgi:hypothetical protein
MLAGLTIAAVLTAQDLVELRTILQCGTADVPTRVCCRAAEDARRTAEPNAREILNAYLRRNCQGPGRQQQ